jgi:hypothetical protein
LLDKLEPNSAVLCVEADENLFEISQKNMDKNSASLSLVKLTNAEKLCAFVRDTWGERIFRRVEEIRLSGGWQLFPQLYGDLIQALSNP